MLKMTIVLLIILVSCQTNTEPDLATSALLLSIEPFPPSWEVVSGSPRPMGPATIGFGDEDDSYISFKLKSSKYIIADHFVLHYPSESKAENGYATEFSSGFNDNRSTIDMPWQTPPELSYASTYADQFHVACTINNVAGQNQVCKVIARYGKYVTIFQVMNFDAISLDEFNDVVKYLDEMMIQKLNLTMTK